MAASAMGLVRELLRPRRLCGTGVSVAAGFLSTVAVASTSDGGRAGAACPSYPWSPEDGTTSTPIHPHRRFLPQLVCWQRMCVLRAGRVAGTRCSIMQHDCAACHSGLPYAGLVDEDLAAGGEVEPKAAAQLATATATMLHGGACSPYLSVITKMLEGLRRRDLYNTDDIKKTMALPSPVWLQFLQPYMSPQAA